MPLTMTSQRPSSGRPLVVAAREERDAVAGADRQFAAARDRGARVGIDVRGAGLAATPSRRRS